MGYLFLGRVHASMTIDTGDDSMNSTFVAFRVDDDFFPYLQRRYRATSTLSARLHLLFFNLIGGID